MLSSSTVISKKLRSAARKARDELVGTLVRVKTTRCAVALTFDDGPHPEYTPRLLEILERHGARGTFFMLGKNARAHPQVVQLVAKGGHAIGNHSWDHPAFPAIPARERREQLRACAEATVPYGQPFFRPPYTLQSVGSHLTARRLGYEVVAWSVDAQDWRDHDADWLANRLLKRIKPGGVIVLHDAIAGGSGNGNGPIDRRPMLEAVSFILEELGNRFSFLSLPELLSLGQPVRKPWFIRRDEDW